MSNNKYDSPCVIGHPLPENTEMKKIERRFFVNEISRYDFDGTLEEIISRLEALRQPNRKFELELDVDYDDRTVYNLYEIRLETDTEYLIRVENEKRQKIMKEERDRQLLKQLKEKYDNK